MITVTPRSRSREDRAGDPLDGLVNLFDLGIVLSVAFLLAALSSLHLSGTITRRGLRAPAAPQVTLAPGQRLVAVPPPGARVVGQGTAVGMVYRLKDGRLVLVEGPAQPHGAAGPGGTHR